MDLLSPRFPKQADDPAAGSSPDDGVIHQHHPLPRYGRTESVLNGGGGQPLPGNNAGDDLGIAGTMEDSSSLSRSWASLLRFPSNHNDPKGSNRSDRCPLVMLKTVILLLSLCGVALRFPVFSVLGSGCGWIGCFPISPHRTPVAFPCRYSAQHMI